jgi:NADH dehydrogenase [ubiquinone] 1 alpha subcomplex assembly factor 6
MAKKNENKTQYYLDYCSESVRKLDYEHYFCLMFLKPKPRAANLAIRAFNIETATIKDTVSRPELGLLRMAFWRDTIDLIYKNQPVTHPVAKALHGAVAYFNLTKGWFLRLLEMRAKDVVTTQPQTVQELEDYAEHTASSLLYLSLETLGIKNIHADHVASHLGRATGLVTLLRGIPFHSSKGQIYLPIELTVKHGVSSEQVFRRQFDEKLAEVVYDVANVAKLHLEKARQLKQSLPREATPIFLVAEFWDDYLERLRKAEFNPFHPELMRVHKLPRLSTKLKIFKNYFTKSY